MKMFWGILFLIFVSLIYVALPRPIFASCSLDQGNRQYSAQYTLTDSGSAQCKPPNNKPNGPYTVWCDTQTEAYAADSVRQPLCGSSEERGKANSTCWSCGGTVKCDGLDFALGATDPFISQIRNPVNPGDTNMDQVWRIPNAAIPNTIIPNSNPPQQGFLYNGLWYKKPSGDIIACGSNNLACGSSEECTNITYPEINNRGRSGAQQCQIYSFQGVTLPPPPTGTINPSPGSAQSSKGCINIGDYSAHFNELEQIAQLYKEKNINGWIYILALPEWMDSISAFIAKYPQYNYMIRLHHPDAELSPSYANRWIDSLKNYAGAIPTKIYLMPVNEPNNADPRRHVDPETVRIFVSALAQGLNNAGLLNTKYILTSPMIDPFEVADEGEGYLQDLCRDNFCNQFSALAVAPYGEQGASGLKHGDMTTIQKYFPGVPLIAAETGLVIPGQGAVYGSAYDQEMAAYFHEIKPSWNSQNIIAACVFSYNPDTNGDHGWIYSATNVQNELFGLGQSIPPLTATTAQPPSTPSTISYESCTEAGVPKIPSKTRIPNLVSPPRQNSDSKLYTVTGVTFPVPRKKINGMISLADNILKYPVMSTLATMLDNALPALLSLATQQERQKIAHPLTITADTKVCVESEDGEVRARPIKNDIRTEYKDLNKLVGATPYFASILGLKKLTQYEQNNMAKLHPDLAPGGGFDDCPDPPQALSVREMAGSSGGAQFEVPEEKSPIYRTASRWLPQGVLDNISKLLCLVGGSADCNTDFDPQYHLNIDLINPYMTQSNDLIGVDNQTGKHTGFVNSFAPGVLQKFLGNDPGKIFHKVNQNLGSNFEAVDINLNTVNAQGIQTHERFLRCAVTSQSKQYHDTCTFTDVRIPNTSDWAIDGWSAISSGFTPQTGSIQDAIVQAAQSEQIPQCVLEGVGYIEGAYNWQENDPRQQSCPRNICSAAGPFQITTGVDGKGDASCSACDSSWVKKNGCPNTWGSRPGNPCSDYTYAAQISAQILKGKVSYGSNGTLSLTAADPRSQKDAIILAGNGYYGGDARVGRLGGCSYGEFVYQRCDPSYTCAGQVKR